MAELLSVSEMRALVLRACQPLAAERVPLVEAAGRVLAEPLQSTRDLPGFDNSAMDGVGVRAADVAGATADAPAALRMVGEALPGGARRDAAIQAGEAVRIMTGAWVPPGVDAVVMREACDESQAQDGVMRVKEAASPGQHIRRRGEDVRRGDAVAARGDRVTPARLNLLLASGHVQAQVVRRPVVCVLASGDELRDIGEPAGDFDVINSNAHAVAAAARLMGCEVRLLGIARDTLQSHEEKIDAARGADVLLTIGGISAGTHDFVRPALASRGATLVASKVAMRPGKPLALASMGSTVVLGLPGNPVSAMISFTLFVAPALRALEGDRQVEPRTVQATLVDDVKKKPGFEYFLGAQLDGDRVRSLEKQGSHQISALAQANALVVLPRDADGARAGDVVACMPLHG